MTDPVDQRRQAAGFGVVVDKATGTSVADEPCAAQGGQVLGNGGLGHGQAGGDFGDGGFALGEALEDGGRVGSANACSTSAASVMQNILAITYVVSQER